MRLPAIGLLHGQRSETALTRLALSSAVASIVLGTVVMMGWHLKNDQLVQVLPSFVPMQYNTALGFVASGFGIFFLVRVQARAALAAAVFLIALGFFTMLQYIFNVSFGIDQLIVDHYITTETSDPGRMAPNTALSFFLTGIAIIFYAVRIPIHAQVMLIGLNGALIASLGAVALAGYLSEVESAYGWGELTRMAVHTAVGFAVVGSGICAFGFVEANRRLLPTERITGAITLITGTTVSLLVWQALATDGNTALAWVTLFVGLIGTAVVAVLFNVTRTSARQKLELAENNEQLTRLNQKLEVAERELRSRANVLEKSNRNLEEFAYVASHDLQEPLRKVQAFGNRLAESLEGRLDEKEAHYIERMLDAAVRMQQLVQDLLTYSRSGSQDQNIGKVSLDQVVEEVLEDLDIAIQESGAHIESEPLGEIEGDFSQLKQLFMNVISNAIKYKRPDEPPRVSVSAKRDDAQVEIYIRDNGQGFESQFADKIFVIFQRLHTREEASGTGVGLAICRRIVERHGGTISASSEPGEGSTFTIKIPATQTVHEAKYAA